MLFPFTLKNEDVIKINTNNNSKGPSLEWINIVKTQQARNKIKAFFKKIDNEEYYKKGEDLLNKELHKKKISFAEFYTNQNIEKICSYFKIDMRELYISIGNGKISPIAVINSITGENETKEDLLLKKVTSINKDQTIKKDIYVDDIDDIKLNLASCCNPIPGDSIIGYITKGYGITVHRTNCPNLTDLNERLISVNWNEVENKKYRTSILIKMIKKDNILLDIVSKASNNNISIESIKTFQIQDNNVFELVILVENLDKLNSFMNTINSIPECLSIERSFK